MVNLPNYFSESDDEEFVAREERLEREDTARYGNPHDDRFTTLYYPQSRFDYTLPAKVLASMDFEYIESPDCSRCQKSVHYSTFRRVRGDSEFCVECLKKMGCCILPGSEHTLVPDLVAMIMSFLPEYYHVTRAARVSRAWLSCFNYDHTHESDMMILKRIWISREIYFRNMLSSPNYEVVQSFIARFDLGGYFGSWMDDSFKTRYNWMGLCYSIAESHYYTSLFGIEHSRVTGLPEYSQEADTFVMALRLHSDPSRCNVYRIPSALNGGGTINDILGDPQAQFTATLCTRSGEAVELVFDAPTGAMSIRPEPGGTTANQPPWYRCLWCFT